MFCFTNFFVCLLCICLLWVFFFLNFNCVFLSNHFVNRIGFFANTVSHITNSIPFTLTTSQFAFVFHFVHFSSFLNIIFICCDSTPLSLSRFRLRSFPFSLFLYDWICFWIFQIGLVEKKNNDIFGYIGSDCSFESGGWSAI